MNKSYRLQISCYSRPMNDKKLAPVPRFQGTPGSIRTVAGQSEEDSGERGLAPVVQTLDSAIHRINHYPADKYYGNQLRYPLDRDLSGG